MGVPVWEFPQGWGGFGSPRVSGVGLWPGSQWIGCLGVIGTDWLRVVLRSGQEQESVLHATGPLDPEDDLVEECYAIVFAPKRRRDRFPENCVEVVDSEDAARTRADPAGKRYAARVWGPSRSSEGLRLCYLLEWIE